MANDSYYAYLPITEDEKLLAEGYITPSVSTIGGSITAKEQTPVGLISGTSGLNYQYDNKEFNPYIMGQLQNDRYNVKAAIDQYVQSLTGNIGNLSGGIVNDPYGTTKSIGYYTNGLLGGETTINAFQNNYDKGINFNWMKEF